jgi:hypothetical protein
MCDKGKPEGLGGMCWGEEGQREDHDVRAPGNGRGSVAPQHSHPLGVLRLYNHDQIYTEGSPLGGDHVDRMSLYW